MDDTPKTIDPRALPLETEEDELTELTAAEQAALPDGSRGRVIARPGGMRSWKKRYRKPLRAQGRAPGRHSAARAQRARARIAQRKAKR